MSVRRFRGYSRGDAMDGYLASLTLVRKPVAVDESSLFRATSEQIYFTQKFYAQLEEHCESYISEHSEKFEHLNQVQSRIQALAFLYKRDFLIYREIQKPPVNVTNFGYPKKVILCESFGNHFDCVYPRTMQQKSAICQSLTYEVLYKGVFHMDSEVSTAVGLIRWQNQRFRHQYPFPAIRSPSQGSAFFQTPAPIDFKEHEPPMHTVSGAIDINRSGAGIFQTAGGILPDVSTPPPSYYLGASLIYAPPPPRDEDEIVDQDILEMAITGPPFPYRVAKALDPVVYRNVEYDVWLDARKATFRAKHGLKGFAYPPGTKCFVRLDSLEDHLYCGVVQEVDPDGESVIVYLPELTEKKKVQTDRLQGSPREFKFPDDVGDANEHRGYLRRRRATWTSRNVQPRTAHGNTSSSWPPAGSPNALNSSPPLNQGQLFLPHHHALEFGQSNGEGVNVTMNGHSSAASVNSALQVLPPPLPTTVGSTDHMSSTAFYTPYQPPPTPPQQVNFGPNICMSQFTVVSYNGQPSDEDMATLRQFYELGGCEYFRQFLAADIPYGRGYPLQPSP